MQGKLIVLEGTDGTGKGTQFNLLVQKCKEKNISTFQTDFPQYDKPCSYFVTQYLTGKYGDINSVDPKVVCDFYAFDRFDAKKEMLDHLDKGDVILSNRYATSNLGHQAAKAKSKEERDEIVAYIEEKEYNVLGLPKPDVVILLSMHPFVAQQLVDTKAQRAYLGEKKRDIHEKDIDHLMHASETYAWLAQRDPSWTVISCTKEDISSEELLDASISPEKKILSIQEIHERIWEKISKELKEFRGK